MEAAGAAGAVGGVGGVAAGAGAAPFIKKCKWIKCYIKNIKNAIN